VGGQEPVRRQESTERSLRGVGSALIKGLKRQRTQRPGAIDSNWDASKWAAWMKQTQLRPGREQAPMGSAISAGG
jgi:hypothetical protein